MKKTILLLLFFASLFTRAQNMTVEAGTTKTLTAAEATLTLHKLVLGDNCTIIIPESMKGWTVIADDVVIGMNVKIFGLGKTGTHGTNGANAGTTRLPCQVGLNGESGHLPGYATKGKDVFFHWAIRSLGSLQIILTGGDGGNSGNGGNGGKGGPARCSTPRATGCDGGAGGQGGHVPPATPGASGGDLRIEYRIIGNQPFNLENIAVLNFAGKHGVSGTPGKGGLGGDAAVCDAPYPARSAGLSGKNGIVGGGGPIPGEKGKYQITTF